MNNECFKRARITLPAHISKIPSIYTREDKILQYTLTNELKMINFEDFAGVSRFETVAYRGVDRTLSGY